jgi:hypothetical protein
VVLKRARKDSRPELLFAPNLAADICAARLYAAGKKLVNHFPREFDPAGEYPVNLSENSVGMCVEPQGGDAAVERGDRMSHAQAPSLSRRDHPALCDLVGMMQERGVEPDSSTIMRQAHS